KQDGEQVESDEVIAKIDTEKAGAAKEEKKEKEEEPAKTEKTTKQEEQKKPEQQSLVDDTSESTPQMGPAVRNMLQEHNLDASKIPTAKEGRLTKEDVQNYLKTGDDDKSAKPAASEKPAP